MAYNTPGEWLNGGGGAPAHFKKGDQIGKSLTGKILKLEVRQERDFKDKKPKFYDDGNPIEQLVITLQTAYRDPEDQHDDGQRRTFIKNRQKGDVREATAVGGSPEGLEIGGILTQTFVGMDPAPEKGLNESRRFEFTYISAANVLLASGSPSPVTPPVTPPVTTQSPGAVPGTNIEAAKAALAGLSAEELALITGAGK